MRSTLLAVVLVAAACSSGDNTSSPSTPEVGTNTAAPTALESPGTSTATTTSESPGTSTATSAPVQQPGELPPEALDELGPTEPPEFGGESVGPLGETRLDLETEDGLIQIGGGNVPEIAQEFPLPDDYQVQLASETSTAAGFSGTSALSVEELGIFYREELPRAGYDIVDDDTPTASVIIMKFAGPDSSGDLALSGAPGGDGTTIIVTISPEA